LVDLKLKGPPQILLAGRIYRYTRLQCKLPQKIRPRNQFRTHTVAHCSNRPINDDLRASVGREREQGDREHGQNSHHPMDSRHFVKSSLFNIFCSAWEQVNRKKPALFRGRMY
jgi:hypothetical protein